MNRNQAAQALTPGFDPYVGHADTGSFFSAIGNAVSKAAKGVAKAAKFVAKPVAKALPIVQTVLKNTGPIGMVASGALSAMQAGLSGKNLESIAWAAAQGAAPSGIDKAIGAAESIRHGSNILKTAIGAGLSHFTAGSPEKLGYESAIAVLKKTGSKAALGVARRALPTEGARRAFDSAIGTVSQVVDKNPAALAKRAASIPVFSMSKAKGIISPFQPNLKHAIDSLKRNPSLITQNPLVLANKLGTTQQTILQALKNVKAVRTLPWRSMSPGAANFVKGWANMAPIRALTHGTGDTSGLDENGTHYIVTKGDSPFSIAKSLTGNGNRWKEMLPLNKDKKPSIDKNVWVGEVLNIPPSWQKPVAKAAPSPGPAQTSQPSPERPVVVVTPAPTFSPAPGILQAKSILAAWGKTDGLKEAGVPNYGQSAEDLSTEFGPRDTLQLTSFQNWNNKSGGEKLAVDGKLGPKSLAALQSWAEQKASAVVNSATPVVLPPTVSNPPAEVVTTLPEIVIEGSAPSAPSPTPVVTAPSLPAPTVPAVSVTPVVTAPPTPPVATPAKPATPATVAAANPSGSKMGPALAGAAAGGLLFGLPGAIIGGIAGAAIS